ncbi:hypothetical protein [Actinomadura macra]|uniref:hypothetical protein n=1 Tax=Actinomadura macra TaxID=46164 RepID=UPI000829E9EA|nr:hypothetical protein [Actinomadura macra]
MVVTSHKIAVVVTASTLGSAVLFGSASAAAGKEASSLPQIAGDRAAITLSARSTPVAGSERPTVINCPIRAAFPYLPANLPKAVAGESTTNCSVAVPRVGTQAELYRWYPGYGWALVGTGEYKYKEGTYVTSAAAEPCRGHGTSYYKTVGYHDVIFPVGYTPRSARGRTESSPISVTC